METIEAQRIYIGGLNPPNLTVEMVQDRMKASFSKKLSLAFDDINSDSASKVYQNTWGEDARTFFFVTAKTLTTTTNNTTPLELITKQYHNVKWKGCSITVQRAKLNFLQRLEVERKEARELEHEKQLKLKEEQIRLENEKDKVENNYQQLVKSKKRHLRIRKQHGEEAYMVDTKPIDTQNWNELETAVEKHREKYKKHGDKLIESRKNKKAKIRQHDGMWQINDNFSLQSKVFLNRAIRLRFPSDKWTKVNNSIVDKAQKVDEEIQVSSHNGNAASDKEYNWSDEEHDDDDDDDDDALLSLYVLSSSPPPP